MSGTVSTGRYGEAIAKQFLVKHGYEVLGGHWQKRIGEIDIIAKDPETQEIVFVEVKTYSQTSVEEFGQPEEMVLRGGKLQKVAKTAQWYLMKNKYPPAQGWRIDVIGLVLDKAEHKAKVRHYKSVGLDD